MPWLIPNAWLSQVHGVKSGKVTMGWRDVLQAALGRGVGTRFPGKMRLQVLNKGWNSETGEKTPAGG